jgi:hypothetical protein
MGVKVMGDHIKVLFYYVFGGLERNMFLLPKIGHIGLFERWREN